MVLLAGCVQDCGSMSGYKDEHCCNLKFGETWCEAKQKCLREWEEPCNATLNLNEAREIALQSDCMNDGNLTNKSSYNENTNTWWFDLDTVKSGCAPACVVDEKTKTAQTNWRCTGALPATNDTVIPNENYTTIEFEDDDLLSIDLFPPIPENPRPTDDYYRSDRRRIKLNISGNEWIIVKLNSTLLKLGKEREDALVNSCDNSTLNVSGKEIDFLDVQFSQGNKRGAIFCEVQNNGSCGDRFVIYEGDEPKKIGSEYLHVWNIIIGFTFCDDKAPISIFSNIIELNSNYLIYERNSLKSISIPKNSSVYGRLAGG
jgi:hypothetical protein